MSLVLPARPTPATSPPVGPSVRRDQPKRSCRRWVAAREHFAAGFDALRDHFLEGMDVLFGVAGEGSAGSKKESGREGSPEL